MIRLATTPDARAIGALIMKTIQGATQTSTEWVSNQIDRHTTVVLVDEDDEQVQGFIIGQVVAEEAEIYDVGVRPSSRRKGIGTRLIVAFERSAREQGAMTCVLEVRTSNIAACEAYAKAGYRVIGQRDGYYSDGENALVMRHDF